MTEQFNISDAFKALSTLNEDIFDVANDTDKDKLKDFIDDDNASNDLEVVIDPDAETEEDLEDSYVGKVILACDVCHSLIFKAPEEVHINEEDGLANVGEECPYCQSPEGFKIEGSVAEYSETDDSAKKADKGKADKGDTDADDDTDDADSDDKGKKSVKESVKRPRKKNLREGLKSKRVAKKNKALGEDFEKVEITANGQKIKVETEPADDATADGGEVIAPIDDATKSRIEANSDGDDGYEDIDIDEIDETQFDKLGEGYLKRTYENVSGFKTTRGALDSDKLMIEGIITFKSGKQAKTQFVFESAFSTKRGKLKFLGENRQVAQRKNAFTLVGTVQGKKFVCESLSYDYRAKDAKTGKPSRLYGKVACK